MHFDLTSLLRTAGPFFGIIAIGLIVFAESGLFFGFFLPGDSLLFTAGFLASQGVFNLPVLLLVCFVCAVIGDNVGYMFGKKVGKALFEREDSRFFKKKHLVKAHEFYEKHGGKAIVLARFMPIVRTFAPIVAGAANMTYKKFATYNVIGGLLWGVGVTLAGYILGSVIPNVDRYLLPIIAVIVIISVLPPIVHILQDPEAREHLRKTIVNFIYSLPGMH